MRDTTAPPAAAELIERIGWLITLRWVAIAGTAGTLEVVHRLLHVALSRRPLYAVLISLALYNLLLSFVLAHMRREQAGAGMVRYGFVPDLLMRVALTPVYALMGWFAIMRAARSVLARVSPARPGRPRRPRTTLATLLIPRAWWGIEREWDVFQAAAFASAQISLDLFALAGLLHYAGGIENPFVFFFVFHVIISSMLLSRRATFLQTTLGFALISAVALGEYLGVLQHYSLALLGREGSYANPAFLAAQLLVLGTTLYLSAYMAGSIAARLRFRERETALLSREVAAKAAMLEDAYQRLSHTEQAKSQYMRKVAHELRGPLGTVQTTLKVVLNGTVGEVPGAVRELVGRAERRVGELAQVTVDLLALSRAREGHLAIELVDVDLEVLVRELVAELEPVALGAGVSLAVEVKGEPGPLRGERTGLRQLVGNLIGNALRYTPRGGVVTVRLERQDGQVVLEVEDTGIGIAPEDVPRLFEEFFRAPNARDHAAQGTGLGLAIVKAVAQQHRGRVSVSSELGHGSRFKVELPGAEGGEPGFERQPRPAGP